MRRTVLAPIVALLLVLPAAAQDHDLPTLTRDWRDHEVWYDGLAECAVYDGTRTIYGQVRHYQARIYTNKERASAETFTKSATAAGREVFKYHVRDNIPTENYNYHYSTMAYVGTDDLKSLKLDMGSIEDCGATFKQVVNHDGTLQWQQFSYFPNEGRAEGTFNPPADLVFQDALGLVLRGYPFDEPRELALHVLPEQASNKWSPVEPVPATVRYVGRETLSLPVGEVEAHHVRVVEELEQGTRTHDYWFAVEGDAVDAGPGLHIMVQYEGPGGQSYRLREVERHAYWE